MWCFTLLPSPYPSHHSPQTHKMPQNNLIENLVSGVMCVTFKFSVLILQTLASQILLFQSHLSILASGFLIHARVMGGRLKKQVRYVGIGCMIIRIRMRRETYHVTWTWGQQWCQVLSWIGMLLRMTPLYSCICASYGEASESCQWAFAVYGGVDWEFPRLTTGCSLLFGFT